MFVISQVAARSGPPRRSLLPRVHPRAPGPATSASRAIDVDAVGPGRPLARPARARGGRRHAPHDPLARRAPHPGRAGRAAAGRPGGAGAAGADAGDPARVPALPVPAGPHLRERHLGARRLGGGRRGSTAGSPTRRSRSSTRRSTRRGEKPLEVALDADALAKAMGAGWSGTPEDTLGEFQLSVWLRENGVKALAGRRRRRGLGRRPPGLPARPGRGLRPGAASPPGTRRRTPRSSSRRRRRRRRTCRARPRCGPWRGRRGGSADHRRGARRQRRGHPGAGVAAGDAGR